MTLRIEITMTHPSEKLLCKEIKERFENKSLIWYTDHSLSHSCAVLQKIEKVVPERLIREYSNSYNVLRVGTLVHDIGMAEPCSTPEECEQVRSRHHLLSEARTKEWFDKHQDSNTPLDFGVAVATIARGHADIENLNNNYYDPRFVGSEYVDIRHLISILVVCDYLDMTYTRINQERIRKGEVPLENASHWKICYYTRLASVDDQGGIELGYALPKFDVYKLIPEHHRLELENILKIIKGFLRSEIYSTELSFTIESTKTIFQDIDKEFLLSQSDFAKILTEVERYRKREVIKDNVARERRLTEIMEKFYSNTDNVDPFRSWSSLSCLSFPEDMDVRSNKEIAQIDRKMGKAVWDYIKNGGSIRFILYGIAEDYNLRKGYSTQQIKLRLKTLEERINQSLENDNVEIVIEKMRRMEAQDILGNIAVLSYKEEYRQAYKRGYFERDIATVLRYKMDFDELYEKLANNRSTRECKKEALDAIENVLHSLTDEVDS